MGPRQYPRVHHPSRGARSCISPSFFFLLKIEKKKNHSLFVFCYKSFLCVRTARPNYLPPASDEWVKRDSQGESMSCFFADKEETAPTKGERMNSVLMSGRQSVSPHTAAHSRLFFKLRCDVSIYFAPSPPILKGIWVKRCINKRNIVSKICCATAPTSSLTVESHFRAPQAPVPRRVPIMDLGVRTFKQAEPGRLLITHKGYPPAVDIDKCQWTLRRDALNADIYAAARKMKGSRSRQRRNSLLGSALAGAAAVGGGETDTV